MRKIIKAPAKINLFLSVNSVRADNYHDLSMVMQCISIFDTLDVEIINNNKKEILLTIDKPYIPVDNRNLIYQVIDYMQNEYNITDTFKINVKKLIPTSGGLGGGSSDAASILHFINNAYKLKLSDIKLAEISSKFGSDIPFFIYRHESVCKGRGEIVTPIKKFNGYFILLITPSVRVSTQDIFTKYDNLINDEKVENKDNKFNDLIYSIEKRNAKEMVKFLHNDLEKVTGPMVPEVELFKKRMKELGAIGTLMSGSGPTIFGIFTSFIKAFNCKNIIKKEHKDAFVYVANPLY